MSMAGVQWVIIPVLVASAYSFAHLSMRASVASMSGHPLIGGALPLTGIGRYPDATRRLRQAVARSSRSHAGSRSGSSSNSLSLTTVIARCL